MSFWEEKRKVALNFTKHIFVNTLISKGALEEAKLVKLYVEYQSTNPNNVEKHEIIDALKQACLIKPKTMIKQGDKNGVIEFKDRFFEPSGGVSSEIRDLLSPRIRVRKAKEVPNEACFFKAHNDTKKNQVNGFKDLLPNAIIADCNFELRDEKVEKISSLRKIYRSNRETFIKSVNFLSIRKMNERIISTNKRCQFSFKLKNIAKDIDVVFLAVYFLVDLEDVNVSYELGNPINPGQSFEMKFSVQFKNYGMHIYPIILEVTNDDMEDDTISILVEPTFNVVNKDTEELFPVEPYSQARSMSSNLNRMPTPLPTISGEFFQSKHAMAPKLFLPTYPMRPTLKSLLDREFKIDKIFPEDEVELRTLRNLLCNETYSKIIHNCEALNEENYVKRFQFLLWAEEHTIEKEMQSFSQYGVYVKLDHDKQMVKLEVPGLAEGRPSLLKGDKVYAREKIGAVKWEGVVHYIEENCIYLAFNREFRDNYLHFQALDVEFGINKNDLKMCHRALKQLELRKMTSFLFPTEKLNADKKKTIQNVTKFFNPNIAANAEQVIAIQNIINNSSFPAPYILFGPPGTGKTATIVEAIVQIWNKYKRLKKICVCAPSNSAADLITKHLLQYKIPGHELMRLYALSRSDSEIPDELKKCSNFDRIMRETYFPSKKCIEFKTIIVLTPVTAGRLVSGGITGGHFDYLFMDEAGHAVEPEMIIPIVGLLTTYARKAIKKKLSEIKGSLILAGDPKQLGPVIQSKLAVRVGLDMSLLERLMLQCKLYQKDEITSKYNPVYITKLVNNYRSHGHILHVPNELFYDNELRVAGDVHKINCAANWKELPRRGVPVIFHSIKGLEIRESNSPSYFNPYEIGAVGDYVNKLVGYSLGNGVIVQEQHIGVITPYKKQVQKLRQFFRKPEHNWPDITVASVEEFQGQERLIIIISTVRSQPHLMDYDFQFGLGFLKNAKRFNVAITRAKALLIVIGNPDILICDPNWRTLIEYCIKHDSYVGDKPCHSVPRDFQPKERKTFKYSALVVNSDVIPDD